MHRTAVLVAGCLLALSCGTNPADDAVTGDTPPITTTVRIDTSTTTLGTAAAASVSAWANVNCVSK